MTATSPVDLAKVADDAKDARRHLEAYWRMVESPSMEVSVEEQVGHIGSCIEALLRGFASLTLVVEREQKCRQALTGRVNAGELR